MTPVKDPQTSRHRVSENFNPNHSNSSPMQKPGKSPAIKSTNSKKSASKNLNQILSPRNKIRERKFLVAKKNPKAVGVAASTITCKCNESGVNFKKCPCVAYQSLRSSQEDFFKNGSIIDQDWECDKSKNHARADHKEEEIYQIIESIKNGNGSEVKTLEGNGSCSDEPINQEIDENKFSGEMGCSKIKRRRDKMLEETRSSVPELGSGRVMNLVKTFEKLLSIQSSKDSKGEEDEEKEESNKEMYQPPKATETEEDSFSSFPPAELFFTLDNFGMDSRVSSSLDSRRGSFTSRTSAGGRRSRRNSTESTGVFGGSKWKKKQLKLTQQRPFKLRTEERGKCKEEEFFQKLKEMFMEEEKLRIPIAQGLPWTTDEPECLVKPPVKEITRPIDLKLHSDVRAVERAEFDHYVAEKLSIIEQYRSEIERQKKLAEEEEMKRLRRDLVPRAQPMPYFDRPFMPHRSMKHPTIPREPKFHIPQHKKIKCMTWNDINLTSTHTSTDEREVGEGRGWITNIEGH